MYGMLVQLACSANGLDNAYKSQTFKIDEIIGPRYKCLEVKNTVSGEGFYFYRLDILVAGFGVHKMNYLAFMSHFLKLFIIYHEYVFCDTRNIAFLLDF